MTDNSSSPSQPVSNTDLW